MGRIGMATRDELVGALTVRYTASDRRERGRILDEFVAVSGLHRKHAMRLLRAGQANQRSGPRRAQRLYSEAVREALIVHCGKHRTAFAANGCGHWCRYWSKRWNGTAILSSRRRFAQDYRR